MMQRMGTWYTQKRRKLSSFLTKFHDFQISHIWCWCVSYLFNRSLSMEYINSMHLMHVLKICRGIAFGYFKCLNCILHLTRQRALFHCGLCTCREREREAEGWGCVRIEYQFAFAGMHKHLYWRNVFTQGGVARRCKALCARSHAESLGAMRFNFIPHYSAFVFAEGVPLTPLNAIVVWTTQL